MWELFPAIAWVVLQPREREVVPAPWMQLLDVHGRSDRDAELDDQDSE